MVIRWWIGERECGDVFWVKAKSELELEEKEEDEEEDIVGKMFDKMFM